MKCLLENYNINADSKHPPLFALCCFLILLTSCDNSISVTEGQIVHIDDTIKISLRLSERPGLSQTYLSSKEFAGLLETSITIDVPEGIVIYSAQTHVRFDKSERATPSFYVPTYTIKVQAMINVEKRPRKNKGRIYLNLHLPESLQKDMEIWPMFHYWNGIKNMEKSDLLLINLRS